MSAALPRRSCNLSGLEGEGGPDPYYVHDQADYDWLAAHGFDGVALPVCWAGAEPTASVNGVHVYDEGYLALVDLAVARAKAAGQKVVLRIGQQTFWSRALPAVRNGKPSMGAGMPEWTVLPGQDITAAKISFFGNERGLLTAFIGYAVMMAKRYAGEACVVGFDLFNEANAHTTLTAAQLQLGPFYTRVGGAMEVAAPGKVLIWQNTEADGQLAPKADPLPRVGVASFHWYPETLVDAGADLQRQAEWNPTGRTMWIGELEMADDTEATCEGMGQMLEASRNPWAYWDERVSKRPLLLEPGFGAVNEVVVKALTGTE